MRLMIVVIAVALLSLGQQPRPAPAAVEEFLRDVLVDAMRHDIPRYDLPEKGPIIVQRETTSEEWEAGRFVTEHSYLFSDRALPRNTPMKFKLMTQSDIGRQMSQTRQSVHFVVINNITFYETKAWLEIRGDSQPPTPTFCANHYRIYYGRERGHWTFDHLEVSFCQ